MKKNQIAILALFLIAVTSTFAQVNVDVNFNIKHEVGGVSDFGRERHITLHSALSEPDWQGEEEKAKYLLNDLDVYMGRDNGSASWIFQATPLDPNRPNHPSIDSMKAFSDWYKGEYEKTLETNGTKQFESRSNGMIMGTNPHPTYPSLSYWHMCGKDGAQWLPKDIETSAEWMVEYLDKFFVQSLQEEGALMPEFWEVINEPDMLMNTGAFMVTSWEDLWEYHNLVAKGVKQRLGNNAPKIGGMTWGLHDLFSDDLHRYRNVGYSDAWWGNTPADQIEKDWARKQTESAYLNKTGPWTQWDVLWKGFMDNAGDNMDFYSVHIYDWPSYDATGGTIRSGGHTEAMLEMVEWYDVHRNGINKRKPLVISEYGSVQGAWDYKPHNKRYDWEVMKPFSSMMMQFLERPDYIIKSMPFTPIKATWGDSESGGQKYFYQYKMLRDDDQDGIWEWSDYIKWFELWSEVKGTRVDTKSSDPDVQVDCYIDGKTAYLILNNLEDESSNINLNFFEDFNNSIQNVKIKHLYLEGEDNIILSENTLSAIPSSITLQPDATMILKYQFASNVSINETSVEKKYYGESVSGGTVPHRITIAAGDNTFHVNGVAVPSQAEVILRITANLFDDNDGYKGHLSLDKVEINGTQLENIPLDWKGTKQNRSRYFGTLDIPVPAHLVQTNNTIKVDFHHVGEVTVVNMLVWDFSKKPGRSEDDGNTTIPATGIDLLPLTASVNVGATSQLTAMVLPANATNKQVTWSSNNTSVTTVNASGLVTGIAQGTAIVTARSADGGFTKSATITVTNNGNGGSALTIEAESFSVTGGTFNDGFVPLGVHKENSRINWVNKGDWVEYSVSIPESGDYEIVYYISSPITGSTIDFSANGTLLNTTVVPNNGNWDQYNALNASNTVNFTAGTHIIRLTAGTTNWTWNLDYFTLTKVSSMKNVSDIANSEALSDVILYPNPATDELNVKISSEIRDNAKVIILNSNGSLISSNKLCKINHKVSLSELSAGMYFIQINNGEQTITKRFIKE